MEQVQLFFQVKALRAKCMWDSSLLAILRFQPHLVSFMGRGGGV